MAKEIVKTNTGFNKVSLKNFNSQELNYLMAILWKMRDKGTQRVNFSFNEVNYLLGEKDYHTARIVKTLKNCYQKLVRCNSEFIDNDGCIVLFTLFDYFKIDEKNRVTNISTSSMFSYILNDLTMNYVRFELLEFKNIKGKYSKLLYRQLKQWRQTGFWQVSIDELIQRLDVPLKQRQFKALNRDILQPSIKKLQPFFTNLHTELLRNKRGVRGGGASKYEKINFIFEPEKKLKTIDN
jgi:plasmid replication initiation protein